MKKGLKEALKIGLTSSFPLIRAIYNVFSDTHPQCVFSPEDFNGNGFIEFNEERYHNENNIEDDFSFENEDFIYDNLKSKYSDDEKEIELALAGCGHENISGFLLDCIRDYNFLFLNLSNNNINEVPPELSELNLIGVNLHGNKIRYVPKEVSKYFDSNLSGLSMSFNSRYINLEENSFPKFSFFDGEIPLVGDLLNDEYVLVGIPTRIEDLSIEGSNLEEKQFSVYKAIVQEFGDFSEMEIAEGYSQYGGLKTFIELYRDGNIELPETPLESLHELYHFPIKHGEFELLL